MINNQNKEIHLTLKQAEKDFLLQEDSQGFIITGLARDKTYGINYSDICIPQTIASRPVFKIGDRAFSNCTNSFKIVLPEGIQEIGNGAFSGCTRLASIILPNTLRTIGYGAFDDCRALSKIVIPKGVMELRGAILGGCTDLVSIIVDPDNSVYDSRGGCNAIIETESNTLIDGCTTTTIPNDIAVIGERSFYDIPITKIIIPEGVTEIADEAFGRDGFGETESAFRRNDNGNTQSTLISVVLPKSLKRIGNSAFQYQKKLRKIEIPENVSEIAFGAFKDSGLERVIISESVTRLEDWTFSGCKKLKKIYIPESVTYFGNNLFAIRAMIEKGGVIEGKKGSAAEKYAKKKKIQFVVKE